MNRPGPPLPRLRHRDLVAICVAGAVGRPVRALLSILGIALGVAALVTIVGISNSNRANLDAALRALGPDLLTVAPGQTIAGQNVPLPLTAAVMARRIAPVTGVAATGLLEDATVRRSDLVPANQTGGIRVLAATPGLASLLSVQLSSGRWLTAGSAPLHEVVLGADTARLLGVSPVHPGSRVFLGGQYFGVVGVLAPAPLAPELNSAALIPWTIATAALSFDGHPTKLYVRSSESAVADVRAVLAATVSPAHPESVNISRPSDLLQAKAATDGALNTLALALAAIALLVGGIGVANTMIVAVLERRSEIGLRRALGATTRQVTGQFLGEAAILATCGGAAGALLGMCVAALTALAHGWPVVTPLPEVAVSLATTVLVGLAAGLYPALKAARLQPTDALTGGG
jgi:putative ABC transport system permease protein